MEGALLSLELTSDLAAGTRARRAIEPLLGHELRAEEASDILLLVTELVTNAVRHGTGTTLLLTAQRHAGALRVEVHNDGNGETPAPTTGGPEGGWGLQLVEGVASAWGRSATDGKTLVWFELRAARTG
jgi:signal transduction histidine kinase